MVLHFFVILLVFCWDEGSLGANKFSDTCKNFVIFKYIYHTAQSHIDTIIMVTFYLGHIQQEIAVT